MLSFLMGEHGLPVNIVIYRHCVTNTTNVLVSAKSQISSLRINSSKVYVTLHLNLPLEMDHEKLLENHHNKTYFLIS